MPDPAVFRNYLKFFYASMLCEVDPTPITEYFFFKVKVIIVNIFFLK